MYPEGWQSIVSLPTIPQSPQLCLHGCVQLQFVENGRRSIMKENCHCPDAGRTDLRRVLMPGSSQFLRTIKILATLMLPKAGVHQPVIGGVVQYCGKRWSLGATCNVGKRHGEHGGCHRNDSTSRLQGRLSVPRSLSCREFHKGAAGEAVQQHVRPLNRVGGHDLCFYCHGPKSLMHGNCTKTHFGVWKGTGSRYKLKSPVVKSLLPDKKIQNSTNIDLK